MTSHDDSSADRSDVRSRLSARLADRLRAVPSWRSTERADAPAPRRKTALNSRRTHADTRATATVDRSAVESGVADKPVVDASAADKPVVDKGAVDKPAVTKPAPFAELKSWAAAISSQGRTAVAALVDRVERARAAAPAPAQLRPMTASIDSVMGAPRQNPVVSFVGSVVFNVIGAALQALSGPAVAPPGSNVTARTSTLTMPDSGQTVRADWYFPEHVDSSTRLVYLQHGFMATGPMYGYTAGYLAEHTNSIVVVPTLSSNLFDSTGYWLGGEPMQQSVADLFVGDRPELTESAVAAAGEPVTLPTDFVLVGHSLGGMLVTGTAGRMVDNGAVDDLRGVVLLDAVDTHSDMPDALAKLSGTNYRPVLDISSERHVWNLDGTVGDELSAARPGEFNGVMLVGGRHIDAMRGANVILQTAEYIVAGFSQPQNLDAVPIVASGWINDMFDGTHDGLYGDPQESIDIPTPSGSATAVVFPFTSPDSVQGTPWDGVSRAILNALFPYAVYEPVPTTEV